MTLPLLITDCDEVLLHMIAHFSRWLGEAREIDFNLEGGNLATAMRRRSDGLVVPRNETWPLLDDFFATEMHRQTLVPHARDALARIAAVADIVILTNLGDHCHAGRVAQLDSVGINHRVICNQGGKGPAVAALIEEFRPSAAVFVDDLPQHHESVASHAPDVWRLHMIAEPVIAKHIPPAPFAHARIDDWSDAVGWVLDKFAGPASLDAPLATAEENAMSITERLGELGITLPAPAAPVAAYVPAVEHGGLLHVSGQLPFREDGSLISGRLGESLDVAAGAEAARRCGIMLVAQIRAALGGDLDRVERIVKLGGFVASDPSFTDQPKVVNGASELMVALFGDAGRHARSAVGVAALPLGAAVEIDAIVAVRPA